MLAEKEQVNWSIAHFMSKWRTVIGELALTVGKRATLGESALRLGIVRGEHALTAGKRATS